MFLILSIGSAAAYREVWCRNRLLFDFDFFFDRLLRFEFRLVFLPEQGAGVDRSCCCLPEPLPVSAICIGGARVDRLLLLLLPEPVSAIGVGNSERPLVEDIDLAVDPVEIFAFRLAFS